jgi:hypothetical protein
LFFGRRLEVCLISCPWLFSVMLMCRLSSATWVSYSYFSPSTTVKNKNKNYFFSPFFFLNNLLWPRTHYSKQSIYCNKKKNKACIMRDSWHVLMYTLINICLENFKKTNNKIHIKYITDSTVPIINVGDVIKPIITCFINSLQLYIDCLCCFFFFFSSQFLMPHMLPVIIKCANLQCNGKINRERRKLLFPYVRVAVFFLV